jgi:type II secretory pathway component PulJ
MKKGLSIVINIILFAIIVVLAWQVVKSIQAPIKFSNEQKAREAKVIERLIDIRNAEVLYKNANNKYTDNLDTLIKFCQTASIPVVKMTQKQNLEDSTYYTVYDTLPERIQIADTLLRSNSIRIEVVKEAKEKAKEKAKNAGKDDKQIEQELKQVEKETWNSFVFNLADIKWVPFSEPQQQFELEAGVKSNNLIEIPVFEARAPFEMYLTTPGGGIGEKEWKQRVDNAREEKVSASRDSHTGEIDMDSPFYRYPGLKVGSMKEASTEGNWDKL